MQLASNTQADATGRAELAAQHVGLIGLIAGARDKDAFKALYAHFGPRVTALLIKSGADKDMAEDIAQDVMVSVWRKAPQYRRELGSVSAWIFTIARNARIDRLRRRSSQPYQDIDEIEMASDLPDGEADIMASQRFDLVSAAIADLPHDQRQVIELSYIEDIPQSEIAARLGLPLGTVKSRMRLAYGKMKARLEVLR